FDRAQQRFVQEAAYLPAAHARGLLARHGTVAHQILAGIHQLEEMGKHFGAGLYECELRHLIEHEWARTAEDVLWRRTKFGLRLSAEQTQHVTQWMATAPA
ncbi:MAG TPA: glycerol-3-phosphate dehydrogenase C-terminal domain-containing protein, partial [Burkholderiaceae bacterium]|nr:glycerol-3-phosphate dehydrogenase C-terminal domain-containing protein [Burkholderiaceae bacterium]